MKKVSKDKWEGIKFRKLPEYNYSAVWNNLTTIRFDLGDVMELPPEYSEFYDVGISNKCETSCIKKKIFDTKQESILFINENKENVIYSYKENNKYIVEFNGDTGCPFCYVAANPNGKYFDDICETWKKWMTLYQDK